MRLARSIALVSALLSLLPACGAPSPADDASTPPLDAPLADDTPTPRDAPPAAPDDAPADAPPAARDAAVDAPAAAPTRAGQIDVLQLMTGVTRESALVYEIPGGDRCTTRALDACQITTCPRDGNPTLAPVSAGDIALVGASGARVTLAATATGAYLPATQSAPPWAAGEAVTVTAAGATVPAFAASLTYPSDVTITAPMPDVAYQIALDRAAGLRVAWTPTSHGETLAQVQQNRTDGTTVIACFFPGATGSGTVPPGALTDLLADPTGRATAVTFYGVARQGATAGDFRVTVAAERMVLAVNAVVR